ncbi:hypothetical protein JCM17846_20650 [Iodidimonas nitroreducens]|uniref:Uncharacterized protein n=1 Tax=Iodidimonas nitroreducens TaxID=1236968 RepID=A0A5A7N7S3_9PROT|nr:hypothetical protein JCM17846_20650 [Iodidimonas nitroreducens]
MVSSCVAKLARKFSRLIRLPDASDLAALFPAYLNMVMNSGKMEPWSDNDAQRTQSARIEPQQGLR